MVGDIVSLKIFSERPKNLWCSEVLLIGNLNMWHIESIFWKGNTTLEFKVSSSNFKTEI